MTRDKPMSARERDAFCAQLQIDANSLKLRVDQLAEERAKGWILIRDRRPEFALRQIVAAGNQALYELEQVGLMPDGVAR